MAVIQKALGGVLFIDEAYTFDSETEILKIGGEIFKLGDEIMVKAERASKESSEIDFLYLGRVDECEKEEKNQKFFQKTLDIHGCV